MATHTVLPNCRQYLNSLGNRWIQMEKDRGNPAKLQPGPYLYIKKAFKHVYRLHDDTYRTFLTAVKPKPTSNRPFSTTYKQLKGEGTFYDCLGVAVPPRPASAPDNYPLSQLRVAVKDCYFLEGLKNSLCNKSYYGFSDPAPFTPEAVHSMIGREEPLEAVDFRTSFNSRGEEYQSLVGSSNGSAACVAGYDWIDCAIGTDTSSSGRRPAMRYHSDLRSLRHTRRICQEFRHTQGCCSDLDPKNIDPIREAWKQSHPLGTPENLDDYLIDTVLRAYYNAFYHSFVAFREKYAEKHSGKPPYALPSLQYRWETGAAVSEEQHKDAVQRMGIYRDWLLTRMLAGSTSEAEPLVVLPIGNLAPNYREESSPSPLGQSALDQLFLPPILVAPDIAIPIGEVPYESKITKGTEYLPVVIDITGAPTKDQELLQAIEKIMDVSGRPTTVTTGLRVFQCQV